jgi:hypothetical protein
MSISSKKETDQKIQEYFKCKQNPIYFIEKYIELEAPGGNVLMRLYKPQKRVLKSFVNDHHVIALKSRQIGISTLVQVYLVWVVTFYKNVVIGMVSRDGAESTNFCRTLMNMIRNLPDFLRPEFEKDTEQTFILANGCKFFASQVNESKPENLFRGRPITIAVVDEAAFISKIDEAYTGMAPALFKSQKTAQMNGVPFGTFIISTPNRTVGKGSWYYKQWKDAQENNSIFKAQKVYWKEVDEFINDPLWYSTQCQLLGNVKWKIEQELEMKFVASDDSFFDSDVVFALNDSESDPIVTYELSQYKFFQYVKNDPSRFYLIGIDSASAGGLDYSAIQVVDYETFQQCGEFKERLRVDDFCKVIERIVKIFPNNLLIVENNSYGNQVVEFLTKNGAFYRLYKQKVINTNSKKKQTKWRYGLWMGPQTRPLAIDGLYTLISEDPGLIKGRRTILELIGLVRKNNRVQADEGENDDLSLALSFCAYVKLYDPPIGYMGQSVGSDVAEQIIDTIGMNFDEKITSNLFNIESEDEDDKMEVVDRLNRAINKHVKNNLNFLSQQSSGNSIDITKLMGFNSISGYRDTAGKPLRTKQLALDEWNFQN